MMTKGSFFIKAVPVYIKVFIFAGALSIFTSFIVFHILGIDDSIAKLQYKYGIFDNSIYYYMKLLYMFIFVYALFCGFILYFILFRQSLEAAIMGLGISLLHFSSGYYFTSLFFTVCSTLGVMGVFKFNKMWHDRKIFSIAGGNVVKTQTNVKTIYPPNLTKNSFFKLMPSEVSINIKMGYLAAYCYSIISVLLFLSAYDIFDNDVINTVAVQIFDLHIIRYIIMGAILQFSKSRVVAFMLIADSLYKLHSHSCFVTILALIFFICGFMGTLEFGSIWSRYKNNKLSLSESY